MFLPFVLFRSLIDLLYSQTAIYAQGVGLGASKGKELGKYAEGYSGYVHMAQDAVSAIRPRDRDDDVVPQILTILSQRRLGSAMGAKRDSIYSVYLWFILLFSRTLLLSRNYIYYSTTTQDARMRSIQYTTNCYKARKPMIGAKKRATTLRVVLSAAFTFCPTTPVG